MKKLLLIVNPKAGKTKSHAPLYDAVVRFSRAGYLTYIHETTGAPGPPGWPGSWGRSMIWWPATAAMGR